MATKVLASEDTHVRTFPPFTDEELAILKAIPDTAKVKNHLIRYGSITQMEANKLYGITRLSDVIYKLKRKYPDMVIETVNYYNGKDRFGQSLQYGRYFLKEIQEEN